MSINVNLVKKLNINSINHYLIFCESSNPKLIMDKNFSKLQNEKINKVVKDMTLNDDFVIFDINSKTKVILVNVNKDYLSVDIEIIGAKFFNFLKSNKLKDIFINTKYSIFKDVKFFNYFLHGLILKSYEFNIYKTIKKSNKISINILLENRKFFIKNFEKFKAIENGTNYARDLVSEPPNVLNPKEYTSRLKKLKKFGVKVTVYNETQLKKLGMNSLLGVGRGSYNESFLVTLEWYGDKKNKSAPLSFVGKGVCFDTGGISLKPAKFMEEMKYDMAGSAVVAGLVKSLAIRKAKINVVGVVGLVENMPGGNAQRPGDIVRAYNGKTIEVLNTDAEGRLVLADALSFTEKKFKPKFMIDLATLTGAIIIALGEEYAGLFSNNDELSKKLSDAGEKVNEKVWRLPLHKNYDKLMDSTIADIQNINYSGGAGSITAAQFLQRFVEKTPWAHLDIAGMAFSKKAANLNPGGATGFGVRLLNQLIEDYYE